MKFKKITEFYHKCYAICKCKYEKFLYTIKTYNSSFIFYPAFNLVHLSGTINDKIINNIIELNIPLNFCFSYEKTEERLIEVLKLSNDSIKSLNLKNAGGSSNISEALSIQFFENYFNATNFCLEMEIKYWIDYKMCDYLCDINGVRYGVSVTRGMGFISDKGVPRYFTKNTAYNLLRKKLNGLIIARNCVNDSHNFSETILHIFCQSCSIASLITEVYPEVCKEDETLKNLKIIITVCNSSIIYYNWIGPNKIKKKKNTINYLIS
jgi:hypothetical protein